MSQITTKETAAGMGAVTNIAGNTGVATPAAGVITVTTGSANTQGTAVFTASGSTVTQTFSDADGNLGLGANCLNSIVAGSATNNVALGVDSATALTTGDHNVMIGGPQLYTTTGSYNCFLGSGAGNNTLFLGSESSNILIGYQASGIPFLSNTLQIGKATGTGAGELARAIIYGIDGVNVGSTANIVTILGNQLGSATVTAGTGVSIATGANTITVNATGGGVTWSVISADQTAAVNNGYFCNKAGLLSLALPATSAVGDVIEASNINTAVGLRITQAAGQQIFIGNTNTTLGAGGYIESLALGDSVKLVCRVANTTWQTVSMMGNFTVV